MGSEVAKCHLGRTRGNRVLETRFPRAPRWLESSLKDSILKAVTSHQSVPGHFSRQCAGWVVKSVRRGSVRIGNIFSLSHVI